MTDLCLEVVKADRLLSAMVAKDPQAIYEPQVRTLMLSGCTRDKLRFNMAILCGNMSDPGP